MTNDDLRNIELGLLQLKRLGLRPVMNFMVTFAINTLNPAFKALTEIQNEIRAKYLDLDQQKLDQRNPDGTIKLLPDMRMEDFEKEIEELFTKQVEVTLPKFKFRVIDFMESNVTCAPEITGKLGPLVDFTDFEDFVVNIQKASSLPIKGATNHKS